MPQSDRNNGLFHCLPQAGDGEVHHGKQTGRQARTVERGYFREASHKPRQQAMAFKHPDMGHVWIMCLDYACFVKHTLAALEGSQFTHLIQLLVLCKKNKTCREFFYVFNSSKDWLLSTFHCLFFFFFILCLTVSYSFFCLRACWTNSRLWHSHLEKMITQMHRAVFKSTHFLCFFFLNFFRKSLLKSASSKIALNI